MLLGRKTTTNKQKQTIKLIDYASLKFYNLMSPYLALVLPIDTGARIKVTSILSFYNVVKSTLQYI